MEFQTDICEICGANLIARQSTAEEIKLQCHYCHADFEALIACPNGHFICDACHSKEAKQIIFDYCASTTEKNPFIIADHLLKHPSVNMYGPEHHILVPLVLLAMIKNLNLKNKFGKSIETADFQKAIQRASKIPGGWCGFYGSCGAGIGAGVAISIFTDANPSKAKERTSANKVVAQSLDRIADDLEHCCKRSLKIAIEEGISMISELTQTVISFKPSVCHFRILNDRCEGSQCPFFSVDYL